MILCTANEALPKAEEPNSPARHDSALEQGVRCAQVTRLDLPPEATDRVFGDAMLEMELLQLGGQLSGTLAYNTGLFKESTAERVASQYQVCRLPHRVCTCDGITQAWAALPYTDRRMSMM